MHQFDVVVVTTTASSRKQALKWLGGFIAVALVAIVAISTYSPSHNESEDVGVDYREHMIARSTKVSSPPSEDPRVGKLFGKLLMLSFDCVIELKRALRGKRFYPDYDAEAKVSFVEGMLHHVVRSLDIEEIPPPNLKGRRASFAVAVKKVKLLKHLLSFVPEDRVVSTQRGARYAVLKYDIDRIANSLYEIVQQLMARDFAALEPRRTAMDRALDKIEHAKIDSEAPVYVAPTWDDVGETIKRDIIKDSIEDQSTEGGVDTKLPRDATGIIEVGRKQPLNRKKKSFMFTGTMNARGDLVGNLIPEK